MVMWKRILYRYTKKAIRRRDDRKILSSKVTGAEYSGGSVLGKRKTSKSDSNKVRKMQKLTEDNRVCDREGESVDNGISDRTGETDRISELPESIIHHIFTFLRCAKDVVRTTVLSKHWRSMFDSYPSFDFDQKWFQAHRGRGKRKLDRFKTGVVQRKRFRRYVIKSIATRVDPLVCIDKFKFSVNNVNGMLLDIPSWIGTAIEKNVKELDFQLRTGGALMMVKNGIQSSSLRSLKLSGSLLYDFYALKLCSLRELSIKDSKFFVAFVFKKFEESCPLLEDLRLVCCPEISNLEISSLVNLRRLEVQDCAGLDRIDVSGSDHLESFWYHAEKGQECKIDIRDGGNLKNLTLKDRKMTDSEFEDWIHKCPLLEKLVLHECHGLEKFKISSKNLKSLALTKCVNLCEANIDAPNLYALEYSGPAMPFHSLDASRLCRLKLSFSAKPHSHCAFGLQDIFGDFGRFKGLKLIMYLKLNMKIFDEPSEAPLVGNNFEKIELTASLDGIVKTVDNWLRECHGKSLILVSSNSELIELTSRMITGREDNPSCCRYYSNKCWRHNIEDVKVSKLKMGKETCYDFTWRSTQS